MTAEFTVNGFVRHTFGFANPNHAAAAICALFPFCWGWGGKWRWVGRLVGVALCAMLAMTYSRTGMLLMAIEAIAMSKFKIENVKCKMPSGVASRLINFTFYTLPFTFALWWMWPRLALDGAVMNRPKIWLAGFQLFAANPMGVGVGNSGEIASAFMLPDGITVRTLVNSHLTLLAEMGAFVRGAWLAFIALALCVGRRMRRTRVAFAGLAVSAFSASVFDWHVLFDVAEKGGYGGVNFVLAWALFVAFVAMGAAMIGVWGWEILTQRRRGAECAEKFGGIGVGIAVLPVAGVVVGLCAVVVGLRSEVTPRVEGEFVVVGKGGASVYRDGEWSLTSVAKLFSDGARFCIRPGVPEDAEDSDEVWLFGDTAESAWRFPAARLMLVDPPEFFDPPTNAVVLHVSTRSTRPLINAESQSR